jgi:uncharacterized protein YlzI (FlbEa/FlbD family)
MKMIYLTNYKTKKPFYLNTFWIQSVECTVPCRIWFHNDEHSVLVDESHIEVLEVIESAGGYPK